jgi:phosphoglycolate phosphatase
MSDGLPAVIFDLDGTLTDSKPGILGCLREVLVARGIAEPGPLDRFIGPPVEEWVVNLLPHGTHEDHVELAREYRACYDRTGWNNNAVYPGVAQMLAQLRDAGFPLYVCTSKHEHFAVRILEAFNLAQFFAAIYGDKLEYASHTKTDLLARVLSERGLACEQVWMVGDRSFDIEAAHANGIRCVAAEWGYGTSEEWAQADAVAQSPADVIGIVAANAAEADGQSGEREVVA